MRDQADKPSAPWLWRHQLLVNSLVTTVVAGSIVNIVVRNDPGGGLGSDISGGILLGLMALSALALPTITRRWQIWLPVCGLSVAGWALFIGPGGDLSCVDCGFALLIPLATTGIQLLLVGLAMVLPSMRQSPYR